MTEKSLGIHFRFTLSQTGTCFWGEERGPQLQSPQVADSDCREEGLSSCLSLLGCYRDPPSAHTRQLYLSSLQLADIPHSPQSTSTRVKPSPARDIAHHDATDHRAIQNLRRNEGNCCIEGIEAGPRTEVTKKSWPISPCTSNVSSKY